MEKIIKSFSIKKLHLRGHYLLIAAILIAIPIGFTIVQIQRVVSQDVNQNQLTDRKNEITNQVVTFDEETITEVNQRLEETIDVQPTTGSSDNPFN